MFAKKSDRLFASVEAGYALFAARACVWRRAQASAISVSFCFGQGVALLFWLLVLQVVAETVSVLLTREVKIRITLITWL